MKKLMIFSLMLAFTACTKSGPGPVGDVGCVVEKSVASVLATTVGTALNCTNVSVIQSDLLLAIGKANLCQAAVPKPGSVSAKGVVGGIVCPLAVQAVLGLVQSKIPATWGCAPGASTATLGAALTVACTGAVGI